MTYYKIVRAEDKLYSQWSILRVEYKVGEFVKAPIGRLFAYDNYEFARLYTRDVDKLFLCEVNNPIKPHAILNPSLAMCDEKWIKHYWKEDYKGSIVLEARPVGWNGCKPVVIGDAIKLLEEIK